MAFSGTVRDPDFRSGFFQYEPYRMVLGTEFDPEANLVRYVVVRSLVRENPYRKGFYIGTVRGMAPYRMVQNFEKLKK